MKLKPLRNNVLIQIKKNDRTKAGLYIHETAIKERPMEGVVKAIGKTEELKVGNKVFFVKHGQTEIENTDLILISEEDIMAVIL